MIKLGEIRKNILEKIIQNKRIEIEEELTPHYLKEITSKRQGSSSVRDFKSALSSDKLSIIAELKKASPSKGLIRPDFDPVKIAESYQKNGASCISILTEKKFFQGQPEYVGLVQKKVSIPLLRKDFVIDERQVIESYFLGADAILLIVAALSAEELQKLQNLAKQLGLHTLVEVHSIEELDIALTAHCEIIGINNRNLTTFKTDLGVSLNLRERIPAGIVTVSESGVVSAEDCQTLSQHQFDAVLIGESLMRKTDPGSHIPELLRLCP